MHHFFARNANQDIQLDCLGTLVVTFLLFFNTTIINLFHKHFSRSCALSFAVGEEKIEGRERPITEALII